MTKLYKSTYTWNRDEPMTLGDHMKKEVYSAGGYGYGQLEELEARQNKLIDIFKDMLDSLPEKTSDRLAKELRLGVEE